MISRWKNIVTDFFIPTQNEDALGRKASSKSIDSNNTNQGRLQTKLKYHRPLFLNLTPDEEEKMLDHKDRPFVTPKQNSALPFNAGYCEVINAGKTTVNEDCSVALTINIDIKPSTNKCRTLQKNLNECSSKNTVVNCAKDPNENSVNILKLNTDNCDSQLASGDNLYTNENNDIINNPNQTDEVVTPNTEKEIIHDLNSQELACENGLEEIKPQHGGNPKNVNNTNNCDTPKRKCPTETEEESNGLLRMDYFAIFDGHAGFGASLYASSLLHQILLERLLEVGDLLKEEYANKDSIPAYLQGNDYEDDLNMWYNTKLYSDSLITGILQDVMVETDNYLSVDRLKWNLSGGCTALVVVFLLGKVYVAGAGDCRAILCRTVPSDIPGEEDKVLAVPMSQDFTPTTERRRLQYLAHIQPSLLGNKFSRLEFIKRVTSSDVGKMVLYRDYHMTGWSYKEVTESDLKHPLVYGSGKAGRLLATIGVTRGLGDHDLLALNHLLDIPIKPFLSSVPEVRVYDLSNRVHGDSDVLILGSDGLWDVMTNEMAVHIVLEALKETDESDKNRYTHAAKELANVAKGELTEGNWKIKGQNRFSSVDDISVFVIPLLPAAAIHSI